MDTKQIILETEKYPELIGKHEAAKILGVCTRTLHNYRKQGKIIGYRIVGVVKYQLSDILEFINKSKTK